MSEGLFQSYRRRQYGELRPYVPGEDLTGVSISPVDAAAGSPKTGDMIARNPANHADQWLVAAQYFADNFDAAPADSLADVRHERLRRIGALAVAAATARAATHGATIAVNQNRLGHGALLEFEKTQAAADRALNEAIEHHTRACAEEDAYAQRQAEAAQAEAAQAVAQRQTEAVEG